MDREMKDKHLLQNEDGSIILIVLIVLMLVTMMGVSSTTTSTIEVQIAGNEKLYKENFYSAEGAVMEAMQTMDEADTEALKLNTDDTFDWILANELDLDTATSTTINDDTAASTAGDGSRFYAVSKGFTTGTSLGMVGSSQLYTFEVHGFIDRDDRGRAEIEVGFKRRF
jgi:Tfp pilus assembly protein PilX